MPLAHSKLQLRVGGGRVLDIWYLPAPEAAGERYAPVSCHEYLSTMRVWKSCEGVAEQWQ